MATQYGQICVEIEKKDGDNTYKFQFTFPHMTPLGVCYDAAFEVLKEVVKMSEIAAERAERKAAEPEGQQVAE